MNRWLVVMAREPRAGAVKTRLAGDIGIVMATAFYRSSLANLLRRVGEGCRWSTVIAVSPDTALLSPAFPASVSRTAQGSGNLGTRMQRMFDGLPPGPVVIIGTDIPEITARHIDTAFRALGSNDAVIGPGDDGGYWLIGLRRTPKILPVFDGVRWSSPHTLDDTLANLEGARVARLDMLRDVDGGPAWRSLKDHASRTVAPVSKG